MTKKLLRYWLPVLVLLLAASGVSLAAWSDNLTIGATVNTGRKDVVISDLKIRADRHINATISREDDRTLRLNVNNLYPGGKVWIDFKAVNRGTIPVRFQSASLSFEPSDSPLIPYLRSWCWLSYDVDGDGFGLESGSYGYIQHPWGNLENLDDRMNNHSFLKSLVLAPGGWISFEAPSGAVSDTGEVVAGEEDGVRCICIKLDESAPNDVQGQTLSFTLQLNFVQWNAAS